MDQQQQHQQQPQPGGVPGPTGRRLHIAHRRSPSELTPLMSMYANPGSKSIFLCFPSLVIPQPLRFARQHQARALSAHLPP